MATKSYFQKKLAFLLNKFATLFRIEAGKNETLGESMADGFDKAFEDVVGVEGGYSNHPDDRGGPTKYGITQDVLASYRGKAVNESDVKSLSLQEAKLIYRQRYWLPMACDKIKSPILASILFDQGVNRGISAAAKTIQMCLNVKADGMVGPKTIEAINEQQGKNLAVAFIFASQEAYARIIQNNHSQAIFLVGWLRRTHKLFEMVLKS